MQMKLGKRPTRKHLSTPAFGDFLTKPAAELTIPPAAGWEYAVPTDQLEILGNDRYGDCAEAGAMHFIQTETANTGAPLHGTLDQTLALYSRLTGFDPTQDQPDGSNPTDQGTDLLSLLQYWKTSGIQVTDASGAMVVHRILGWAALDLSSITQLRYGTYIFGGSYLGIQCPQSAEDDTSNWLYQANSPVVGGHCINGTGEGTAGQHIQSWGLNIPTTWEFLLHQLDEAYIVVSELWLNKQGKSPSGLDLNGLLAAMQNL